MARIPLHLASALLLAAPGLAQDPLVFVGTSVGGSADPHFFVRPATNSLVHQGGNLFTDNVTDAVFADSGMNLYVGTGLQNSVTRADMSGVTPVWSTFYAAPGSCYGLALDEQRQLLYTLTGPTGSTRELVCIDADPTSGTYGSALANTTTLSGGNLERWELSPSGNLAAVPYVFLGPLLIVDTDPASASYMQVIVTAPVPGITSFAFGMDAAVTSDDQWVHLLWLGLGEQYIATYHVPSGTWVDYDPGLGGVQNFVIPLPVPNNIVLSNDDSFLAISGQGGTGWAGRIDLDYQVPSNTVLVEFQAGMGLLADCDAAGLSFDSTMMSVSANGGSPRCIVLDTATGAVLSTIALPGGGNIYTTAWQDLMPPIVTYCTAGTTTSGCVASISGAGVPSATAPSGFTISVASVEGQKQGLIFYGISGPAAAPWGTSSSFLCVKAPTQRTPVQSSGGSFGACDGTLSIDWNTYISTHPGALGTPFSAGALVNAQAWFRDPPSPKTTMLSDGLEFTVSP